jgi:hypothetical protein
MSGTDEPGYPCPACHAPADLATGCTGCGRPPDRDAAQVVALDRTIARLTGEVEAARTEYAARVARLNEVIRNRNALADRVTARTVAELAAAATSGVAPAPAPRAPEPAPAPARAEPAEPPNVVSLPRRGAQGR